MKAIFLLCAAFLTGGIFSGCALLELRNQSREIGETGFVAVQVEKFPANETVYVLALDKTGKVLGAEVPGQDGFATFVLPLESEYSLLAFADANGNRRFDRGEIAGVLPSVTPVPLGDASRRAVIRRLRPGHESGANHAGLTVPHTAGAAVDVAVGEVADVGGARFSPERGSAGMWTPQTALKSGQLGLFFARPYDPTKIPVVFVHGIGGSPQDFVKLIPTLDQSRFQAWFFTYPSGYRLDKVSTALAAMLETVTKKYGIRRIHIVAHSMGGLVSRAAILKMDADHNGTTVDRFVTISTPWAGHEAAKNGVRYLRHPVPAWIDMAPGSDFLKRLWAKKLPAATRHWLIFGYDTKRCPWLTLNNDQVINQRSALYLPAQMEAVRVLGLERNHEGILMAPETAEILNGFLTGP